jgi:multiple sugar transport system permease protein
MTGTVYQGAIKRHGSRSRHETIKFYAFISPWLIGVTVFVIGPMFYSLWLSFTDATLGVSGKFAGLLNYTEMFTSDRRFIKSLANTAYYAFVSIPVGLLIAFILASLLNLKIKVVGIFRTIFYMPSVVAGVAITLLWAWMYNPDYGLINNTLSIFGIQGPRWLTSTTWAMPAVIIMSLWNIGGPMLIFLAGLQGVPTQLYESAEIDGAGWWKRTINITIPMITPVIFFNLVMGIIGGFQVFTQVYILTSGVGFSVGGPRDSTYVYVLNIFQQAFKYLRMGYGCALAWVLFLIILGFSAIIIVTRKRWVYSEGSDT